MVVSRRGASARAPRTKFESESSARIVVGDCVAEMSKLPAGSVDLVFADPPYNLQLKGDLKRPVSLRVITTDRPGILAEISHIFSEAGVNISQASCRTMAPGERAVNDFEVTIGDLTQLKAVMRSIERIDGVTSVERA